jgi:hypothetical protein
MFRGVFLHLSFPHFVRLSFLRIRHTTFLDFLLLLFSVRRAMGGVGFNHQLDTSLFQFLTAFRGQFCPGPCIFPLPPFFLRRKKGGEYFRNRNFLI